MLALRRPKINSNGTEQSVISALRFRQRKALAPIELCVLKGMPFRSSCRATARFAAIVPAAGGGDVESASALAGLPIWAFHGTDDKTVPVKGSTEIVEAIRNAGGKPKLTIFPKTGHGIGNQVFSRTDVYDWLLRQKRSANVVNAAGE